MPSPVEETVLGTSAARQILGNSMVRIVGSFQRSAEKLFERTPGATKIPRRKNVFENLSGGSEVWRSATGKGYEELLGPIAMADLLRFFQQRHLLAHCEE
jgi:hypothetical protein